MRGMRGQKKLLEALSGALLMGCLLFFGRPFRRRRCRWGLPTDVQDKPFPGDQLGPNPEWSFTHAVSIEAPLEKVWPWVVQIGQGRGGFYSYEGLEALIGCKIHNTDRILPEFQKLEKGDSISLHPKAPPLPVLDTKPGHWFVLEGVLEKGKPETFIWVIGLEEISPRKTLLYSRGRSAYGPGLLKKLQFGPILMEPIIFVMNRKMLLTIKMLTERSNINNSQA